MQLNRQAGNEVELMNMPLDLRDLPMIREEPPSFFFKRVENQDDFIDFR